MPQVFGCPHCQNPFQVPDDAAGQTFECPSCNTPVEVPTEDPNVVEASDPEVFECPHCSGQFGINSSMYGQHLSCPHCKNTVAIGEAPDNSIPPPVIETEQEVSFEEVVPEIASSSQTDEESTSNDSGDVYEQAIQAQETTTDHSDSLVDGRHEPVSEPETKPEPEPEPVFEQQPVDHLLPPTFDVPDPVRFPARLDADEVFLPDGKGGYKKVDANIVTITHRGEVYHLQRMTPQQRRRRSLIHNSIAIAVAVLLIYLTLKTIGLVS